MAHAIVDMLHAKDVLPASQVPAHGPAVPTSGFSHPLPFRVNTPPGGIIDVTTEPDAPVVLSMHFLFDYYYRIWILPLQMTAQNPSYNVPIPFFIWNAYPQPATNLLQSVVGTDDDGLEIDGTTPALFRSLEYRQMSITITPDAPPSIDASFLFDFALGQETFRFIASIANVINLAFEEGSLVTMTWLTDVLQNYNGSEQRIALRQRPRRTFNSKVVLENDAARKQLYDTLYKGAASLLIMPCPQTQARLVSELVLGDNKIYCDTKRADLRVGGYCVIMTYEGHSILYKIETVFPDHVVVDTPHAEVVPLVGSLVMAAVSVRVPDGSGLKMRSVSGEAELLLEENRALSQLPHPSTAVTLETYAGLPVLARRPLADEAPENFMAGLTVIDNGTGTPQRFTSWDQKFVTGERKYLSNTLIDPNDIDWWLTFFDYCRGQQKSFFTPTYREDLVRYEAGVFDNNKIDVEGRDYAQIFFGTPTYMHLEIVTSIGTFHVGVDSVSVSGDHSTIFFDSGIIADLTDVIVHRISYLMRVRLASDMVTINYFNTYAHISLGLKAVME